MSQPLLRGGITLALLGLLTAWVADTVALTSSEIPPRQRPDLRGWLSAGCVRRAECRARPVRAGRNFRRWQAIRRIRLWRALEGTRDVSVPLAGAPQPLLTQVAAIADGIHCESPEELAGTAIHHESLEPEVRHVIIASWMRGECVATIRN